MGKPRIFVSSTIHDFRDLRSALKYWLEKLGFEVLLSEFNDFTKRLETNSYEACLETVAQSDYFILLIGSRVGGQYPGEEQISITRKEYRTAYTASKRGGLKLGVFVREDLWTIREDRRALEQFLSEDLTARLELDSADLHAIASHRSRLVNDAEATFDFINEVSRASEMKAALKRNQVLPPNNWVHTFSTFGDVIEALAVEFGLERPLSRVAIEESLRHELTLILQELTTKSKGKLIPITYFAGPARRAFTGGHSDASSYSGDQLLWLKMYRFMGAHIGEHLPTSAAVQAIHSGEFLTLDHETGAYAPTAFHSGLQQLRSNIERLGRLIPTLGDQVLEVLNRYSDKGGRRPGTVENVVFLNLFAIYDCQENIIDLASALHQALSTQSSVPLEGLSLRPTSPLSDEAIAVEQERATAQDIAAWVAARASVDVGPDEES